MRLRLSILLPITSAVTTLAYPLGGSNADSISYTSGGEEASAVSLSKRAMTCELLDTMSSVETCKSLIADSKIKLMNIKCPGTDKHQWRKFVIERKSLPQWGPGQRKHQYHGWWRTSKLWALCFKPSRLTFSMVWARFVEYCRIYEPL